MFNLIVNEINKIVKKKSFLIILIIGLAFSLLTNFIYSAIQNEFEVNSFAYWTSPDREKELELYDLNNKEDFEVYINDRTQIELYKLADKYKDSEWQKYFIVENDDFHVLMNEKVLCKYDKKSDKEKCEIINEEYDKYYSLIKNGDYYAIINKDLEEQKEILSQIDKESTEYEVQKYEVERLEYIINNKVEYGSKTMNNLNMYYTQKTSLLRYKKQDVSKLDDAEKLNYYELKEQYLKNEYYLTHNEYNTDMNTLSSLLQEFFNEFGLIIMIMILMISGTIMSQEYNKGTIKLLLVKPYTRTKILLSKYITSIIMVFVSTLLIFAIEFVTASITFGLSTLSQPVLVFDQTKEVLITMNVFKYNFLTFIGNLPFLLFIDTVAFAISTIFGNTAVAIISGFGINIVGNISTMILNRYDWCKYLIFSQWDISQFLLTGHTKIFDNYLSFSVIICLVYLLIVIIPTFIIFKKKDIKNI